MNMVTSPKRKQKVCPPKIFLANSDPYPFSRN